MQGGGKEVILLATLREQLGKPSEEEESIFMETVFEPIRNGAFANSKREDISSYLKTLKIHIENSKGNSPSRVSLTAEFLQDTIYNQLAQLIRVAFARRSSEEIRFFHDIQFGTTGIIGRIMLAELELSKGIDASFNDFLEDLNSTGISVLTSGTAQSYMKAKTQTKFDISKLIADPSGFSLVDAIADSTPNTTSESISITNVRSARYVTAGANLTRDLYKIIYPLSDSI